MYLLCWMMQMMQANMQNGVPFNPMMGTPNHEIAVLIVLLLTRFNSSDHDEHEPNVRDARRVWRSQRRHEHEWSEWHEHGHEFRSQPRDVWLERPEQQHVAE